MWTSQVYEHHDKMARTKNTEHNKTHEKHVTSSEHIKWTMYAQHLEILNNKFNVSVMGNTPSLCTDRSKMAQKQCQIWPQSLSWVQI